jgi:ATP adenylyltransferase
MRMLEHFGGTESFNVGWNQGQWSGGSIAHFHAHVIPRYKNDINFVDIIAKSRPVLHSLERVEAELKKYQPFLAGEKQIDELDL